MRYLALTILLICVSVASCGRKTPATPGALNAIVSVRSVHIVPRAPITLGELQADLVRGGASIEVETPYDSETVRIAKRIIVSAYRKRGITVHVTSKTTKVSRAGVAIVIIVK
jgi:hypothetical protein